MKQRRVLLVFLTCLTFSVSSSFLPFRGNLAKRPGKIQTQKNAEQESMNRRTQKIQRVQSLGQKRQNPSQRLPYTPGEVLVKFKHSLPANRAEATIAAYDSKKIRRIPRVNVYEIQIPEYMSVEEMVYLLSQNPDVEYAEPNYRAYLTVTPNDPFFKWQYALYNSGQKIWDDGPRGKPRADIKATEAWEETMGENEIIIAVLDSGVDMEHPDLMNKIHSNGRDFVNGDFDATDDLWHGTHVAGIIAAETNNEEGIAGVTWNSKILPVKVIKVVPPPEEPYGEYSWIIDAIIWAVDNGADILNLSLGGEDYSQAFEQAAQYAFDNNVLIIAASGNDGPAVLYPAAFDDFCLAVAATDYSDDNPSWSNSGPEVDVAAPGVDVLSLVPTWYWGPGSIPYAYADGTSMAAPHAAGLAALIKGIKPWLDVWEIMDIIRYSADDVNSSQHHGKDDYIGYGRINMEKALVPLIISRLTTRSMGFR